MNLTVALSELGIHTGDVDQSLVKSAYRSAMREWHPDRFQTESEIAAATEKAQRLNSAYEVLTEHLEDGGRLVAETFNSPSSAATRPRAPRHTYRRRDFTPGFPDPKVFEVFMKSSNVLSAGYNADRSVLFVKFHNGYVYEYTDVPARSWDEFRQAESHGKYGNEHIFRSFKYRRCTEPNQPYSPQSVAAVRRAGAV